MKLSPLRIILLVAFVDLTGFGLIIPLQAVYADRLHATGLTLGLMMGAYSLMQLIFNPVLGRWSDRVGRRRVLLISVGGSVLSHVLLGVADLAVSLPLLFTARILDGITGANVATAQAYIADVTTGEDRAKGMGLFGAAFGLGFVVGPGVGAGLAFVGRLVSGPMVGTSWPAFGAAAASLVAFLLVWRFLPDSRKLASPLAMEGKGATELPPSPRGDRGGADLPPAARGHTRGLENAPASEPTPSTETPARFSLLSLAEFRSVLTNPRVRELFTVSFFNVSAFVLLEVTFVYLFAPRFGLRELGTGLIFVYVGVLMVLIQGGLVGRLARWFGEATLVARGPFINAFGFLMISMIPLLASNPWSWTLLIVGYLPIAVGQGITGPSLSALISRQADEARQGATLGLFQGVSSLSRAVIPPIAGLLYDLGPPWPYWIGAATLAFVGLYATYIRPAQQKALATESDETSSLT